MGGSGERIDFAIERQRHARFVGREDVLARLDELLLGPGDARWVVVTGGPGTGACILTHRANAALSALEATEATMIAGDRTGAVWFLTWPRKLVHGGAEPALGSITAPKP